MKFDKPLRTHPMWGDSALVSIAPEYDKAVSLVCSGRVMMNRARQIAISTQELMQSDHVSQRMSTEERTKSRSPHLTDYWLPTDIMACLEDKSADMQAKMVSSWVVPTNQDKLSDFGEKTT